MKQLLFTLLAFITFLNTVRAEDSHPFEGTSWNIIRERLFNGENSNAYRFEEDIRFQLIGAKTHQDSAIVTQMIVELNGLLETIQIKMVDKDPNFTLTILQEEGGQSSNSRQLTSGYNIISVNLELGIQGAFSDKESIKQIYYHTIRQLTKLFAPRFGSSGYGGIFDSSKASESEFKEKDKDLLNQLYSTDFYKELRKNTVRKYGLLYYLNLRFEGWIKKFSIIVTVILIVLLFLLLLSYPAISSSQKGFWEHLKRQSITLICISIIYGVYSLPNAIPFFELMNGFYHLFINLVELILYGVPALILIYYSDRLLLKRINNFYQQQIYVLITTFLFILLSYWLISIPFAFSISREYGQTFNITDHLRLTKLVDITIIASLRVLYNFIQFRIQSMVNQKDVEIAKMKELKNQAELHALHSRINPHFLYNSLNSIASLAHTDADKTENMATGLSDLFRYSINKENKTFVSVAEELAMVKKYLEIEKTRFGNRLTYEINAGESTLEKQIPKFLIQPLVENAIKHGLSKMKGNGKIRVEIKQEGKDLLLSIFDNGPDFPDEPVSGYGLQNLHDKLNIIYGNQALINWENGAHKNFTIMLKNQFEL